MASGLILLLDDIALLADDVAVATKVATKKTAGILGDDVAVSAQQATGFAQERELKIIWAIMKGSLKNKIIILPIAFLLSIYLPFLIPIILVLGAFYLLYEGVEKVEEYILEKVFSIKHKTPDEDKLHNSTPSNILEVEKDKIKSAILTDFILSIEIIIIALSAVLDRPLTQQITATTFVALLATFGVYGLVAAIVRIDNVGFWLISKKRVSSGTFLINLMPKIITFLTVVGTIAMVLVGGEILLHNIPYLHHSFEVSILNSLAIGLIAGSIIVLLVSILKKIKNI